MYLYFLIIYIWYNLFQRILKNTLFEILVTPVLSSAQSLGQARWTNNPSIKYNTSENQEEGGGSLLAPCTLPPKSLHTLQISKFDLSLKFQILGDRDMLLKNPKIRNFEWNVKLTNLWGVKTFLRQRTSSDNAININKQACACENPSFFNLPSTNCKNW